MAEIEKSVLIERIVLEAMKKQHPVEAAVWQERIDRGEARVI